MNEWREEHLARFPEEFEKISEISFMQRRNIVEVSHEAIDGMPAYTEYICECREISVADYVMLINERTQAKIQELELNS